MSEILQTTPEITDEEAGYFDWITDHIAAGLVCVVAIREIGSDTYARALCLIDPNGETVDICPVALLMPQQRFMELYEAPEGAERMQMKDGEGVPYEDE